MPWTKEFEQQVDKPAQATTLGETLTQNQASLPMHILIKPMKATPLLVDLRKNMIIFFEAENSF
ncbi:MAG: hypothetical protein ACE5G1_13975 [bacterium]